MSRKIEFRAWDNVNLMMLDIPFVVSDEGKVYLEYVGGGRSENIILMQFTNFQDAKGIKIYEGDIIENDSEFWSVEYIEYLSRWEAVSINGDVDVTLCEVIGKETFVVGNIYENPELLKNETNRD